MCLGIPGKIIRITDASQHLGLVDVSGIQRAVNLRCVSEPNSDLESLVGRWVLVHVGFAMSVIDEKEAAATLEVLSDLGDLQEELQAMKTGTS